MSSLYVPPYKCTIATSKNSYAIWSIQLFFRATHSVRALDFNLSPIIACFKSETDINSSSTFQHVHSIRKGFWPRRSRLILRECRITMSKLLVIRNESKGSKPSLKRRRESNLTMLATQTSPGWKFAWIMHFFRRFSLCVRWLFQSVQPSRFLNFLGVDILSNTEDQHYILSKYLFTCFMRVIKLIFPIFFCFYKNVWK